MTTAASPTPRVRWGKHKRAPFRGAAAHQHKLWNPVFVEMTGKPGTWALIDVLPTRAAANRQVTSLRKYLRKTRKGSAEYFQLVHEKDRVYCRYMPPSVTERYTQ